MQTLQGEVRAKELEMDTVTERAQQLHKATTRNSQIAELAQKYQQVSTKVKVKTYSLHTISFDINKKDYKKLESKII